MGRPEPSSAFLAHKEMRSFEGVLDALLHNGELQEGDEDAILSVVESESNLKEIFERLLIEEEEVAADIRKVAALVKDYGERKAVLTRRKDAMRGVIAMIMDAAKQQKMSTAYGTVSRTKKALDIVVRDESLLDEKYWIEPPKPDLERDDAALKADALSAHTRRSEAIETARLPFAAAIEEALSIVEDGQRAVRLAEIDAQLEPAIQAICNEHPLPSGVEIAPQEMGLTITRSRAKTK